MQILAISNPKGGTAKTTTAVYLAHAFAKLGEKILLIDADPNKSATEWSEIVDSADKNWPINYAALPATTLHKNLRALAPAGTTRIIIDSPPLSDHIGIAASALRAADSAVITFTPGTMEYARTLPVWDAIEELDTMRETPLKTAILLNRVNSRATSTAAYRGQLEQAGHHVLDTYIRNIEAFKQSFAHPITECYEYFDAALELRELGL